MFPTRRSSDLQYAAAGAALLLLLRLRQPAAGDAERIWPPGTAVRQLHLGGDFAVLLRRGLQRRDFPVRHRGGAEDRKSTRLNSSHECPSSMPDSPCKQNTYFILHR